MKLGCAATVCLLIGGGVAGALRGEGLSQTVQSLDANVMKPSERQRHVGMIQRDIRRRRSQANAENRTQWRKINSRADWEAYRDVRLVRLRESLGELDLKRLSTASRPLNWKVTRVVKGAGFRILNVVYETRPRFWVPANLYVPDRPWYEHPPEKTPGVIIVHSHHRDKTHGELQDMGMTWARAGCQVLVIDQVGYGERRAHPFNSQEDFEGAFKSWRQDYYFRYDSGSQLRLAGDSLMGWFVWDLMGGVDLLLERSQPSVDPQRIVILGSVAGGGDPCAVTAALDPRIAGAVPFNFGGLQPESYPLPENAEETFNFAMSSYWDSTRGLPRTCSDEFFHWTIVGSIAPRPLIYAHEFMWDRQRDPVWKRFQRIWGDFYRQPDHLAYAVGKGSVRDSSDVATHCTHIGRHHRTYIHPPFAKWFDIHATEYSQRVDKSKLLSMTPEFHEAHAPKPLTETIGEEVMARLAFARGQRGEGAAARRQLQKQLARRLGDVDPISVKVIRTTETNLQEHSLIVRRTLLETDEGIVVPVVMLLPDSDAPGKPPVVAAVSQSGKAAFLKHRAEAVAQLLAAGCAVALMDVRGVGETREGAEPSRRGRTSRDVGLSVNMEMFGESILGQRLRDLRSVLQHLRGLDGVDGSRIALWGDSFVASNDPGVPLVVPHGVSHAARAPEPAGGILVLLAALYEVNEDDEDNEGELSGVAVRRGLDSYLSAFTSPVVYLPHDAVIPQVGSVADLSDVAAALPGTPLRMSAMVDAQNRSVPLSELRAIYQHLPAAQKARTMMVDKDSDEALAQWLIGCLR